MENPYIKISKEISIDMSQFSHLLITGDTGTGKTSEMQNILMDLVTCNNPTEIVIHTLCTDKFTFFSPKVRNITENLIELEELLSNLSTTIYNRRIFLNDMIKKGAGFTLQDYNKLSDNKMSYIYIFIDDMQFLFLNNNLDNKKEKEMKKNILNNINLLLQTGKAVGCYFVLASVSYDDLLKNKLFLSSISNKLSFKTQDKIIAKKIINEELSCLQKRQFILLNNTGISKDESSYICSEKIKRFINQDV